MKVVEQQAAFENSWHALIEEVRMNLNQDPCSPIGVSLAKKLMEWDMGASWKDS